MGIDDTFDIQPQRAMKLPPMPPREEFPFLVADHAFDSRSLDELGAQRDPSALCLSFARGELAYVHSVHSSGWGDVTLARNVERGWVPVDYFSAFRDVRAIPLLAAIAAFLAQPRSMRRPPGLVSSITKPVNAGSNGGHTSHRTVSSGSNSSSLSNVSSTSEWTFSDAAINEIISGTKLLLSKCGVVSRDAPLVVKTPSIAAARKSLLVDLAHIVHVAKHNMYATDSRIIDKLVRACHRLLERMRGLLVALDDEEHNAALREQRELREMRELHDQQRDGNSYKIKKSSSRKSHMSSASSTRSSRSLVWSPESANGGNGGFSSSSGESGGSGNKAELGASTGSLLRVRSFNDHKTTPTVEERVREVGSVFSSYLVQFIDPSELLANPEDPQTSPAILSLTRHCMLACRELLVVLDVPPTGFDGVKDALLEEIRRLVSAARSLVASLPPTPASLRTVALHNLALAASKCHTLSSSACRGLLTELQNNPHLSLPDRAYPMFENVEKSDRMSVDTLSSKLSHEVSSVASDPVSPEISPHSSVQLSPRTVPEEQVSHTPPSHKWVAPVSEDSNVPSQTTPHSDTPASASSVASANAFVNGPTSVASSASTVISSPNATPKASHHRQSELTPSRVRPRASKNLLMDRTPASPQESPIYAPYGPGSASAPSVASPIPALILRNDRVRGGTLRSLIKWLIDDYASLEFEIRTFLLVFRLFTSPRDVIIELGSHLSKSDTAVKHVISLWINSFWDASDEPVLNLLAPFVDQTLITARKQVDARHQNKQLIPVLLQPENYYDLKANSQLRSASNSSLPGNLLRNPSFSHQFSTQFGSHSALNLAASFRELGLSGRRTSRQASVTTLDENGSENASSSATSEELLSRAPLEIAAQITLMWFDIFQKVQPSELLDQRFSSSKRKLGLAPHITELVQSSNHLTALVGDTILAGDLSVKHRARVLKLWIRVAHELYMLGNLNGVVTVVLTLQTTRIVRLLRVWESLSSKTQALLTKITPITSPDRNFSEYRRELRNMNETNQFCVPYLGILLGDLTLIDEGNPKLLQPDNSNLGGHGEPIINFDRYLKMTKAIAQIQQFQHRHLDIPADPAMQAWIRAHSARSHYRETRDGEDQWRRSLLIQPMSER